jgi:hypothetical protein
VISVRKEIQDQLVHQEVCIITFSRLCVNQTNIHVSYVCLSNADKGDVGIQGLHGPKGDMVSSTATI